MTNLMAEMLDIFRSVHLKPATATKSYSIFDYYTKVDEFSRISYDGRLKSVGHNFQMERVLPIVATNRDFDKLKRFEEFASDFLLILRNFATSRGCKCFWSCGTHFTPLFGGIKQLQIVLEG